MESSPPQQGVWQTHELQTFQFLHKRFTTEISCHPFCIVCLVCENIEIWEPVDSICTTQQYNYMDCFKQILMTFPGLSIETVIVWRVVQQHFITEMSSSQVRVDYQNINLYILVLSIIQCGHRLKFNSLMHIMH